MPRVATRKLYLLPRSPEARQVELGLDHPTTAMSTGSHVEQRGSGNPDSNKEKQIWLIREKKTKARGNNRKRPNLI